MRPLIFQLILKALVVGLFCLLGSITLGAQAPKAVDFEIIETNACDIVVSYSIDLGGGNSPTSTESFVTVGFRLNGNDIQPPSTWQSLFGPVNTTVGPFERRIGIGPNQQGNLELVIEQWNGTANQEYVTAVSVETPPLAAVAVEDVQVLMSTSIPGAVLLKWQDPAACPDPSLPPGSDNYGDDDFYNYNRIYYVFRNGTLLQSGVTYHPEGDFLSFYDSTPKQLGETVTYQILTQISFRYGGFSPVAVGTDIPVTIEAPDYDGIITGTVLSQGGQPISGVQVLAQPTVPDPGMSSNFVTTTDASGSYTIDNIYYGDGTYRTETKFLVRPLSGNFSFQPASRSVTLRTVQPLVDEIDFRDEEGFKISGTITQTVDGTTTCPVANAEVRIDGETQVVFTDEAGNFTIGVDNPGMYTIRPSYGNHTFSPASQAAVVQSGNVSGIDFADTTTRTVSGFVRAGCDRYIGQAQLQFYSVAENGTCLSQVVTTEAGTGAYQVTLPARSYQVEVLGVTPTPESGLNGDEVAAFFETESLDLTDTLQTLSFTYTQPPVVTITGFPDTSCVSPFPIMEQLRPYELTIRVWEEVGVCPADTGVLLISDQVSFDNPETLTLPFSNGVARYTVTPGIPNLTGDYTKTLTLSAMVGSRQVDVSRPVIVTGSRPRESTFASTSPEVPFLILRDPPGDGSYSFLSQGTTIENAFSMSTQFENDSRLWGKLDLGFDFLAGAFVLTQVDVTASLEAGFSAGFTESTTEEKILSLTSTQEFATNDNGDITGTEGDVFVGAAINLVYAIADVLQVEGCELVLDKTLVVGDDGFDTKFVYTENHIRETLIGQLAELRDITAGIDDSLSMGYANQIKVWEQVLQYNEELKDKAIFQENRSFSGGVEFKSSTTSSSTESLTLEFSQNIGTDIAAELGISVAGIGFSGGVMTNFRMEMGESQSQSTTEETTVGYVLRDDDVGDFFSVDIKTDPVYSTPVFDLVSGRSSCPYEPGTQPRDDIRISSPQTIRSGVDADDPAIFNLELSNISQSGERRLYRLIFNQASNPDGATIRVGGSEIQQDGILYNIGPFQTAAATVTVERGPLAYSYEGLEFEVRSECDPSISKKIRLSAFFDSPCSDITYVEPESGWLVNQASDDLLTVEFKDYTIDNLDQVSIQYAPAGTSNWVTGLPIGKDELSTSEFGTSVQWNIGQLLEGGYRTRLKVDCAAGVLYSATNEGLIDRTSPELFGQPEPLDDEYQAGDRIALRFTEPLNCPVVSTANVQLLRLSDSMQVDVQIGCSGNQLIILPPASILEQPGEIYEVTILGVADANGNPLANPITWRFSVGESSGDGTTDTDLDNDNISDAMDNCPLAANAAQTDLDGDGIGDACDDDIDGDGVPNSEDNAVYAPNPGQEDTDGDGIGDAAEANGDGDTDGVINAEDNCPSIANGEQTDTDGDGIGDACDEDIDGDGILNSNDNCPNVANINQADANNDGIGDACEGTVATQDPVPTRDFRLFPNPARDLVTIGFDGVEAPRVTVELYSSTGQRIRYTTIDTGAGNEYRVELPLYGLPGGLYYVMLQDGRTVLSKKLLIQR